MKFLAFNILVGAALAWLILGGGGAPMSLKSMLPGSASLQQVSAECPADPAAIEGPAGTTAALPISVSPASEHIEPASRDQERPTDRKQLASLERNQSASKSGGTPGPRVSPAPRATVQAGAGLAPADAETSLPSSSSTVEASPGRRDALLSLAESMELFSLERVVK